MDSRNTEGIAGALTGDAIPEAYEVFEVFRRQESTLILLNLCLIVSLMIIHVMFKEALGTPGNWLIALFGARFIMQTAEIMGLHAIVSPWSCRRIRLYEHGSIGLHLLFAAVVSLLTQKEDTHYTVLMVLPVVAAGFRYPTLPTLAVALIAGLVGILEVYYSGTNAAWSEYFEAVSMGLIFLLVAVVVRVLAAQLAGEERQRERSLVELSRTRELLAQEEKLGAIGRLASAVAHEIRNPIAMISSSLIAMDENEQDPALQRDMFRIACAEAARLENFTGDFLAYARMAEPHRETVCVRTALHYVAEVARAQAAAGGVSISVLCANGETLEVDEFQIYQALLNLVKNALEATPAGGEVRLSCFREDRDMLLHVENTGDPIPSEVAARVFEPFFTCKSTGTGLGLGISQNIARAHGGEPFLSINEPNCVRFTLRIPRSV